MTDALLAALVALAAAWLRWPRVFGPDSDDRDFWEMPDPAPAPDPGPDDHS